MGSRFFICERPRMPSNRSDRLGLVVQDRLAQIADRITRVEMHLGDTNSVKSAAR